MLNDKEVKRLNDLKWRQKLMHKAGQFDTVWDKEIAALEAKIEPSPQIEIDFILDESAGDDSEE